MIDYKQANEIRRKYPKRLSRKHIDSIIKEWGEAGIEKEWMLQYSAMFDTSLHKWNSSEKELTLRATMHVNLSYLTKKEFYGMLASVYFHNLVAYQEPYQVPKKEYKLRLTIGKEFLEKCKETNAEELSRGLKKTWEIKKEVNEKYPYELHPYEKIIDEIVEEYIIKE
ncbi:MAG: hypothetical protein RL621_55 [Bacteroidota bacterium]|jgi:hypothetical protein